jgi:hypothetical protein
MSEDLETKLMGPLRQSQEAEISFDEAIAQIKAAFESEGYVQKKPYTFYYGLNDKWQAFLDKYPEYKPLLDNYMTGSAWFDKFLDEFHQLPEEDYKNGRAYLQCAKRAAGLPTEGDNGK